MDNPTPTIKLNELKVLIESKGDYTLVDVRNEDELQYGVIPTSKNVSLPKFEQALELSQDEFEKEFKFLRIIVRYPVF